MLRRVEDNAAPIHSYTAPLSVGQVETLRSVLKAQGFSFEQKPYMIFAARKGKLSISVYEKGPKAVVQGKGLEDFITFVLEPEVLGEARLGYEEVHNPELFEPHFGVDESGKGDFFGPLVVAGVFVDRDIVQQFRKLGVCDSKNISSDKKIRDLSEAIRRSGTAQSVVVIGPERYNALIAKMGNLNRLLAWGHARIIENLCELRPDCPRALSDKFADVRVLERALLAHGRGIVLEQRTKAESDFAVAAASILAREKLIDWLGDAAKRLGEKEPFPRGASSKVKERARELVSKYGSEVLSKVAKMHFKTANEVLESGGF